MVPAGPARDSAILPWFSFPPRMIARRAGGAGQSGGRTFILGTSASPLLQIRW
jgi:hypothetical protein